MTVIVRIILDVERKGSYLVLAQIKAKQGDF